jgi:hypothetical protein
MGSGQREEFERRVLALLRRQLDVMDEVSPGAYELGDFVLAGRYWFAPEPDTQLHPWDGGPYPGWNMDVWVAGSSPADWVDAELLERALEIAASRVKKAQLDEEQWDAADDGDTDESPERN